MTKILIDRAVVEQALEALEDLRVWHVKQSMAVTVLRAALAAPVKQCMAHGECFGGECIYTSLPQRPAEPVAPVGTASTDVGVTVYVVKKAEPVQEPVAWRFEARHIDSAWGAAVSLKHPGPEGVYMRNVVPLYTSPPQRKPLTEEEITQCWQRMGGGFDKYTAFARAVEAAHGIKGGA